MSFDVNEDENVGNDNDDESDDENGWKDPFDDEQATLLQYVYMAVAVWYCKDRERRHEPRHRDHDRDVDRGEDPAVSALLFRDLDVAIDCNQRHGYVTTPRA